MATNDGGSWREQAWRAGHKEGTPRNHRLPQPPPPHEIAHLFSPPFVESAVVAIAFMESAIHGMVSHTITRDHLAQGTALGLLTLCAQRCWPMAVGPLRTHRWALALRLGQRQAKATLTKRRILNSDTSSTAAQALSGAAQAQAWSGAASISDATSAAAAGARLTESQILSCHTSTPEATGTLAQTLSGAAAAQAWSGEALISDAISNAPAGAGLTESQILSCHASTREA